MEDSGGWFPLPLMRRLGGQEGRFRLAPRFHGAPTNRSQRHTMDVDIPGDPATLRGRRGGSRGAGGELPGMPPDVSLTARALEAAGISTVVLGCARDIVEHVGVPRLLFSDFPLGNAAGKPNVPSGLAVPPAR